MFLLLFSIFASALRTQATVSNRIVGGTATAAGEAPYQTALTYKGVYFCGGSLITERCVLTAAHCLAGISTPMLKVRAGTTQLIGEEGSIRGVLEMFQPNSFNMATMNMDVAILLLNGTLSGQKIRTIPLSATDVTSGQRIKVTGWGYNSEHANKHSSILKGVQVNVVAQQQCIQAYRRNTKITSSMFCATAQGGKKDACLGDSGGPAVSNGKQIGIVSWGIGCARPNYPGVYTNVAKVRPWIDDIVAKNC